jgi:hypothetical protein
MKTWGSGGIAPPLLTSTLDGGEWLASRPWGTALGTHWVGPRAGLDALEKIDQPVARYSTKRKLFIKVKWSALVEGHEPQGPF